MITSAGSTFPVSAPTIEVVVGAASIAAAFGGSTGVAIGGAGAVALNSVTSNTNAHIDDSTSRATPAISLDRDGHERDQRDRARGLSRRRRGRQRRHRRRDRHLGREEPDRRDLRRDARRRPRSRRTSFRSSLDGAGRRPDGYRDRGARDQRDRLAGSVAVAAGGSVGVARQPARASSPRTTIAAHVKAFVDGDGTDGHPRSSISLSAHDTLLDRRDRGRGRRRGAAFGGDAGVAVSIAVSLAFNWIANEVEAYVAEAAQRSS